MSLSVAAAKDEDQNGVRLRGSYPGERVGYPITPSVPMAAERRSRLGSRATPK
jgi:hypothetical protein